MQNPLMEQLVAELVATDGIMLVVDSAGAVRLIRFYFPNPWLDDSKEPTEFQPERLKAFEDFRARNVGENDIEFVRRPG